MNPWNELDSMADVARRKPDPSKQEIGRWQKLFGYAKSQAVEHIRKQKSDVLFGGVSVSDLH